MSTTKKHYRIKNRFRFTLFVVIMMLTLITSTNAVLGIYNAASLTIDEFVSVEICYGDTLWDIAKVYMSDIDTRTAVHKICKINDITASDLYPGLTIQIPVYN
ncbi:MAG: LysM peptidoglycan-binding domain-containing protein [Clostridiales bacterium]|nr:LysM peptidoglycan-binding domain-containing protein [Clostridiales bacterium]